MSSGGLNKMASQSDLARVRMSAQACDDCPAMGVACVHEAPERSFIRNYL